MREDQGTVKTFILAFYAWITTVFFGAVLIDTVFARLLPPATTAFSEVSDLLLPVGLLALLAGIAAILLAGKSSSARLWLVASLVFLLLEFLIPMLFSTLRNTAGTGGMSLIRIAINGAVSVLAFGGLVVFLRGK